MKVAKKISKAKLHFLGARMLKKKLQYGRKTVKKDKNLNFLKKYVKFFFQNYSI